MSHYRGKTRGPSDRIGAPTLGAPTSWPSWLVPGSGVRGLHALNEPPPEPPYTVVRVSKTLPFLCRFSGILMILVLTTVPRPEGKPEIAVLDGHIDGASVCIDGLDLGSCTDAPRSFQKLLRREGKELGLKTLADNFFWASVIWVLV
ncbi:hypothetical protein CXB51_005351 [Gossypium anomalum]|uniref:Uncharacterized protein n=1 Tax=Gossypium anomalum TaxID=47600 RepID=A0A8J5ZBY8_9ROSI|nr:hypothetical protein CXB51_005351 [Gossypium anomalum]